MPLPFHPALTVWAMYDVNYDDADDHSANYQKDTAFGVRYDVNANWSLKGEYHDVDGTALQFWYSGSGSNEDSWSYYAFKTSYNF